MGALYTDLFSRAMKIKESCAHKGQKAEVKGGTSRRNYIERPDGAVRPVSLRKLDPGIKVSFRRFGFVDTY